MTANSSVDKPRQPHCVLRGVQTMAQHELWTKRDSNPWPCPACSALDVAIVRAVDEPHGAYPGTNGDDGVTLEEAAEGFMGGYANAMKAQPALGEQVAWVAETPSGQRVLFWKFERDQEWVDGFYQNAKPLYAPVSSYTPTTELQDWQQLFLAATMGHDPELRKLANVPMLWPNGWHQDCAMVAFLIHGLQEQMRWLEELLKACPHAEITYNDDPDDGQVGYSIIIESCSRLELRAPTLRGCIELGMKAKPDEDGNVQESALPEYTQVGTIPRGTVFNAAGQATGTGATDSSEKQEPAPAAPSEGPTPLNCDRDPVRWAQEFNIVIRDKGHVLIDQGLLIAWFANAMMCGEDTYRWRKEAERSAIPPPTQAMIDAGTLAIEQGRGAKSVWLEMNARAERSSTTPTESDALRDFINRNDGDGHEVTINEENVFRAGFQAARSAIAPRTEG